MCSLIQIPIKLDPAELASRLSLGSVRLRHDLIEESVELAQKAVDPKGVCRPSPVGDVRDATIEIAGVRFESRLLRSNLESSDLLFPYIITVGPGLESAASEQDDLLRQYFLEEIANIALEKAAGWLSAHLEERFGVLRLSNISPGSLEDWPITEQAKLFSIFGDTERLIGVRLTESMLMIPRKSISGIFFPSDEGFVACQLCERTNCPSRKADHSGPVSRPF